MKSFSLSILLIFLALTAGFSQEGLQKDVFPTSEGELAITFIAHGSLLFEFDGKKIYIDPSSKVADFTKMPKADLILVTHQHGDHFDPETIEYLSTSETQVILNEKAWKELGHGQPLMNQEGMEFNDIKIKAVPAYNLVHKRENGEYYHPKGMGNGYVLTFGDLKVLVAGDTENVPEIKELTHLDIAFLPMNLPNTMTPEMVVDAVTAMQPKVFYVYHFGESDTGKLKKLLKDEKNIELRIRSLN